MRAFVDPDRRLERVELLTPIDSPAAIALMRASGERDHVARVLVDGTHALVTDLVLPVKHTLAPRARPVGAELVKRAS